MPDDVTTQAAHTWFIQQLRTALNALYDPAVLGHSPLVAILRLEQRRDKVFAVRKLLTEAIESLRPEAIEPADSRLWRVYQILRSRYIEQLPQPEVAADLSLSLRQLQREESSAREVLADYLWAALGLAGKAQEMAEAATGSAGAEPIPAAPTLNQELAWLGQSAPVVMADVGDVIGNALKTVQPLCEATGIVVEYTPPEPSLQLNLQASVLRQALINVASAAMRYAPGGHLRLEVQAGPEQVAMEVCAGPRGLTVEGQPAPAVDEGLQVAGELLRLARGTLQILPPGDREAFAARLLLPISRPIVVLVIDDNADTLQLFHRYLGGSRYQFYGTQDPRQAMSMAEEIQPQVIVLDVMMPEQDGWMLLAQFREYPRTRAIPIIVCTIVAQEQLALSLGAAQFLRKPVNRAALLVALDRQLEQTAIGPG